MSPQGDRDLLVLCYHAVSDNWSAPLAVTPGALERQLTFLLERGYHGATFSQSIAEPIRGPTLVVTFDDAYRSVLRLGLPILSRLGLTATVFVPTRFPDRSVPMSWAGIDHWVGTDHEAELSPMSWAELAHLRDLGWEIGSHTRTHPHLSLLDDDSLEDELEGSKGDCESMLGAECTSIAYPYGDYDQRVVDAARRAGYRFACTLPGRLHPPDPLRWPRIGVDWADTAIRYRFKVSRRVRRARASALWEHAQAVRAWVARS